MSVTITQSPTTPNAAYTRLVYVASGSVTTSEPQYQYVMDVYQSGSSELINRITQVPNPAGVAVFDPSPILQGQLQNDNNWKVIGSIQPVASVQTFDIKFGEQYGTSLSSSVTVYTGSISNYLEVFPGIVNPNNGVSYNFITSSWVGPGNAYLTNCPSAQTVDSVPGSGEAYLMNSDDYFTVTSFQDSIGGSGNIMLRGYYVSNGIGNFVTGSIINAADGLGEFTTWGFGPKNLSDLNSGWADYFNSGSINLLLTLFDPGGIAIYINNLWDGVKVTSGEPRLVTLRSAVPFKQCSTEYTRFAFINRYGFWDYYNVYNPVKTNTDLQRESFSNSFVNYSTNPSPYNANRRGDTQTYLASTDRYSIDTDYIDKTIANWLEELMESPSVYLQEGGNFVPIIITNTEYRTNNSTARNKLFQYTIEWEYANARRSRI